MCYSNLFAGGSPNKTVIEGKRAAEQSSTTIQELCQSIATALTFANIQSKRHDLIHTFPTLRVHPISDHLMLACCKWSENTLFLLWLVLYHNLFSFQTLPKDYENFTCGFHAYVNYSKAMQKEPKYLVRKNSFLVNDMRLEREYLN